MLFNRTAREWHGLDALAIPPEEWSRCFSLYESDGRTPMLTDSIPLIRAFHGGPQCFSGFFGTIYQNPVGFYNYPLNLTRMPGAGRSSHTWKLLPLLAATGFFAPHRFDRRLIQQRGVDVGEIVEFAPRDFLIDEILDGLGVVELVGC